MKIRTWVVGVWLLFFPATVFAQPLYLNYFAVGAGRVNADGSVVDGWKATLLVLNGERAETKPTFKIFDVSGQPMSVTLRQEGKPLQTGSQFEIPLKGNGGAVLNLISDGGLKVGYITVQETPPQSTVSLILTLYQSTAAVAFAGVQAHGLTKDFSYVHTIADYQNSGVAILNSNSQDVLVTALAYDTLGNIQLIGGIRSFTIKAGQVVSQFTTEIFPNLFDPKGLTTGKIVMTASQSVIPLVLLTKQDPGGKFQVATLAVAVK